MVDILLQKIKENCTNVDLDIVNKAFNLAYEAHKNVFQRTYQEHQPERN